MKNSLKLASVLLLVMASQGASAYNWIDCSGTPLFAGDGVQSFGYATIGASGLTSAEVTATSQAFTRLSEFSLGNANLGRGVDNSFAGNNSQNEIWQDTGVGTAVCNWWFFGAPSCNVVEVDIRLGAPTWYAFEDSNHIPYGSSGRSVHGVQVHEGGHCIGLGHVNNLYSIMGQEWTHVNRNSTTTYYGPGEDTSDALIDLHGKRSGGSDTYRDVGVTHWRYSTASGEYSVHKEGRLLGSGGVELPKTGMEWAGQDEYRVVAGASIQAEGTFENNGEKNSENMAVSYRLSTNSIISTLDTDLLTLPSYTLIRNFPFYDTRSGLVIPVTTPPGDYWVGIIVDVNDTIPETTNRNNYTQWPIVIPPPDLTVSAPSVSNTTPLTNQTITGFATINNIGGAQSAATTLRYYRSTNSFISTGDTQVDTDAQAIINPGGSIIRSEPFVFSATPGTFWYGACVDTVAGETVTNNQCSTGVLVTVSTPPDLTVTAPSVSDTTPTTNQTITGFATINNVGGTASTATTLRYYRSTNSIISTGDTQVGTDAQGVISAGGSIIRSEPFVFSATPGTYWYGACVDTVAGETVTNNQCSTGVLVTVSTPPDLTVTAPSVSDITPTTGQTITGFATVQNIGGTASAATTLRYYRSNDTTITTGDTQLATDSQGVLNPGSSTGQSEGFVFSATPGTFWYGACVDPVPGETVTGNQCSAGVRVIVSPPADLTVDTPSVSDTTPTTGQTITGAATVRNIGGSPSAATTLRYYRSADSNITTGDTQLATDAQGVLNPGSSTVQSEGFVFSATPGTYWYGACVDPVPGETVTGNQCSAGVRVIVSTPPDLTVTAPSVSDTTPTTIQPITVFATINNVGGTASGATTLRYYRSTDTTITTADTLLATDAQGAIGPGGSVGQNATIIFSVTPGTYWYGACVDPVPGETITGNQCSAGVRVVVSLPLDTDGDGVADVVDNCTTVANADQRDSNGDGHGNFCDLDYDNNCVTQFPDLAIFGAAFNSTVGDPNYDADTDRDGNGVINFLDLGSPPNNFATYFLNPPGPSASACVPEL